MASQGRVGFSVIRDTPFTGVYRITFDSPHPLTTYTVIHSVRGGHTYLTPPSAVGGGTNAMNSAYFLITGRNTASSALAEVVFDFAVI